MTGKKIRIALCLSGEPRSSMFCFPYIYESFINLGPQYEVDTYSHSWKNYRALPLYNPKKVYVQYLEDSTSYLNYEFNHVTPLINELFKNEYNLNNSFTERINIFQNTLLMVSSIQNCFNLIEESYDIYIRCRYDLIFNSKFEIYNIINDILSQKYDMFTPQKSSQRFNMFWKNFELNDQLAIGNFKSMKSYSSIKSNITNLLKLTQKWSPESWLRKQLEIDKIKLNEYFVDYSLVRQSKATLNTSTNNYNFLDQ